MDVNEHEILSNITGRHVQEQCYYYCFYISQSRGKYFGLGLVLLVEEIGVPSGN